MGNKIFVSYKYSDAKVESLSRVSLLGTTTVRDYVDELQDILDAHDHVNKGEDDGEDLSAFTDDTIASNLRDKIFDSSITIVMISKGMIDRMKAEEDQWIPWEIAYSLRESTRNDRTSRSNALLGVVLPDDSGSYGYYLNTCSKCSTRCTLYNTDNVFEIIKKNLFNIKEPNLLSCSDHTKIFQGRASYIHTVKWCDFKTNVQEHIRIAQAINDNIDDYEIVKTI